mgnify:CR=1 FL=1
MHPIEGEAHQVEDFVLFQGDLAAVGAGVDHEVSGLVDRAPDLHRVAENLQKTGAFIPGVRPGRETEEYIGNVVHRVTFGGFEAPPGGHPRIPELANVPVADLRVEREDGHDG